MVGFIYGMVTGMLTATLTILTWVYDKSKDEF